MSSHATLFLIGIFLFALPFLGFPRAWDGVLVVLAGTACMVTAFVVRREHSRALSSEARTNAEAFVEARPKRSRRTPVRVLSDVREPHEARQVTAPGIAEVWPDTAPQGAGHGATTPEERVSIIAGVDAPDFERADLSDEHERATAEAA